jgi:hypothetical protein
MPSRQVPLTTVVSLLFAVIVVNVYVIALSFGAAAAYAAVAGVDTVATVFAPIAPVLAALGTLLILLRATLLRMIDDLAE